jgi:hypothetical protein
MMPHKAQHSELANSVIIALNARKNQHIMILYVVSTLELRYDSVAR